MSSTFTFQLSSLCKLFLFGAEAILALANLPKLFQTWEHGDVFTTGYQEIAQNTVNAPPRTIPSPSRREHYEVSFSGRTLLKTAAPQEIALAL
jgi:hypothetical protein